MDPRELDSVVDFLAVDLESILRQMNGDNIGAAAPDPEDPDSAIVVEIKEKKRGPKGQLRFKRFRSLTLYGVTLEDVYDRVVKALKDKGA